MTIGEKIKKQRNALGLTQKEVTRGGITRNMLSEIESDKATPSLDSLTFIAERLNVPISYLVSDQDLFFFKKGEIIEEVKRLYADKDYNKCIKTAEKLGQTDDELAYILALCYFELGKSAILSGSLHSGGEYIALSCKYAEMTVYDTKRIEASSLIYSALSSNIQSPLLEFDNKEFKRKHSEDFEYDLYKYLMQDTEFDYKNPTFRDHLKARELMKERKYSEAIGIMRKLEEEKTPETYNAYLIFSLYRDLETCYKQLADFENAYRYSSKRLSIIEGFKS